MDLQVIERLSGTYHGKGSVEPGDPFKVLIATLVSQRSRAGSDAVQRSWRLRRARLLRNRMAFRNTGHPDDTSRNR